MMHFGAVPHEEGVGFRVWAPEAQTMTLLVKDGIGGGVRRELSRDADGIWSAAIADAHAGDPYAFSRDSGDPRPDPASRFQPDGVHGWSEIVDPRRFSWTDHAWRGVDPERAVIYELHVGTFAGRGRFTDVASRLEYLRDLGVTLLELMPVADFPGRRNWGYDGVALFAPSRAYGRPDDLRALVDRAHALGLGVVIDVVYNHLGPEGAYLPGFSAEFFTAAHHTPWGDAVNLDHAGSNVVRQLLIENAVHWIREYHADGLRLDATHALVDSSTPPFVAELAASVRASADRPVLLYAEDDRNLAGMVRPAAQGGWDLDGIWADDFHHVVRRALAGDEHGYYRDFEGTTSELATVLSRGWLYVGQRSTHQGGARGTDPSDIPMVKAVVCVQNHDQIGNRALGGRLHHEIDCASWRAAAALLLTAPMTPLLFMGQEWAASTPFLFFTDFEPALGALVAEGRRREFRHVPEFSTPEGAAAIPDPQADATFEASRLRWEEQRGADHARSLALHRALLRLREARRALRGSHDVHCDARAVDTDTIVVRRSGDGVEPDVLVCVRIRGAGEAHPGRFAGRVLLDTEEPRFAASPQPIAVDGAAGRIVFSRPGAVLVELQPELTARS
jgi:maltooligosyltrehalose trehalohydrolase